MEISDSSLRCDREHKTPLYARAGIQETWLVNLLHNQVEVYRDPVDGAYRTHLTLGPGDRVTPLFQSDTAIAVANLLPPR